MTRHVVVVVKTPVVGVVRIPVLVVVLAKSALSESEATTLRRNTLYQATETLKRRKDNI